MLVLADSNSPPPLQCSLLQHPIPDTTVPVDAPTSRCRPVVGPWVAQSHSRRHQPGKAHSNLLPYTEESYEPLLPRGPSPPSHPTQLLIALIDESLMSFELTSSQINTLHVAGGGGAGYPEPLEKHTLLGEKRLQGHGQEGGHEHGQRAWS